MLWSTLFCQQVSMLHLQKALCYIMFYCYVFMLACIGSPENCIIAVYWCRK